MKQRILVAAITFFGILGCSREAPDIPEPEPSLGRPETIAATVQAFEPIIDERPETIAWGPKDPSGLQLGIWLSEDQTRVMGVVRNAGDNPVRYCDYFLGYVGGTRIEAQQAEGGSWEKLGLTDKVLPYLKGAGPSPNSVHTILPGDEMPPEHRDQESLEHRRRSNPNRTFTIYLLSYAWPESWSGSANIVVSQRFVSDHEETVWTGTLISAPLTFDVSSLKEEQSKLPDPRKLIPVH